MMKFFISMENIWQLVSPALRSNFLHFLQPSIIDQPINVKQVDFRLTFLTRWFERYGVGGKERSYIAIVCETFYRKSGEKITL